jgi:hypothetical protein
MKTVSSEPALRADGEEKKAVASGSSVRRPRFGETSAAGISPAGPRFYMHIPGRAEDTTRATMIGVLQMRGGPRGWNGNRRGREQ